MIYSIISKMKIEGFLCLITPSWSEAAHIVLTALVAYLLSG